MVAALLAAAGGALYARRTFSRDGVAAAAISAAVAQPGPLLLVPHGKGPITLDGDTDDPGWVKPPGPARTGPFLIESGDQAVPYTHVRLVWADEYLYLALFASDEDIECRVDQPDAPFAPDDDFMRIVFTRGDTEYAFDVSPNAVVTDSIRRSGGAWDTSWNSRAITSRELGGTMNHPSDLDEEWEIELAIPLASLGLAAEPGETIGVSFHRCDKPKEAPRVCSGWGDGGGTGKIPGRLVLVP